MSSKLFSGFRWVCTVSSRFSRIDRTGRSAVTSFLATLGICFGVMTLVVVTGVMNGFQMGFKDAIMEISSYHVRVTGMKEKDSSFESWCASRKNNISAIPFREAQALIVGSGGEQTAGLIRALPADVLARDCGFAGQIGIERGKFSIYESGSIVLGSALAYELGASVGSTVNLLALSGGSDVQLLSGNRKFTVTGIFHCGYADINSSYAFISFEDGEKYFGKNSQIIYGLKLHKASSDSAVIADISHDFPSYSSESWRSYNRSFFGVLRVEKNMLMMLVLLIFIVVGINIYNGMRRLVFERRSEISILSALGGRSRDIKTIFILRGFITGFCGSAAGLVLGLLISVNIGSVFKFAADAMYYVQYFSVLAFSPERAEYVQENPMYLLYATIPARLMPGEIFLTTLFGIAAPLAASYAASRNVLKMTVAEVLHDE